MGVIYPSKTINSSSKTFTTTEAKVLVNAIDSGKSFIECVGLLGQEANGNNVSSHYNAILAEKNDFNSVNPYNCSDETDFLNKLTEKAVYLDVNKWYTDLKTAKEVDNFKALQDKFKPLNI